MADVLCYKCSGVAITGFCARELARLSAHVAALEGALRQAEEALERLEWHGFDASCHDCLAHRDRTPEHHDGCALAAALEAVRRALGQEEGK